MSKLGLSFLSIAVISRIVPRSILGTYFLYISVVSVVGTLSLIGVGEGLEKRLSEGKNKAEIFSTGVLIVLLISTLLALLSYIFKSQIESYLNVSIAYVTLGLFLYILLVGLRKALNGNLAVPNTIFSQFLQKLLFFVFIAFFYYSGRVNINAILISYLASICIALVYVSIKLPIGISTPTKDAAEKIFTFSIFAGISQVSEQAYDRTDILLIGFFLVSSSVSMYEIAWQVSLIPMIIAQSLGAVIRPQLSEWWVEGKQQLVEDVVYRYFTLTLVLLIPIVVGGCLLAGELLSNLFTAEYGAASVVLIILLLEKIPQTVGGIARAILYGLNLPRGLMWVSFCLLVTNIVLNIILIPTAGIEGAAIATLVSAMAMSVSALWFASKHIDLRVDWRSLTWSVISSVAMALVLVLIDSQFSIDGIPQLLGLVATGGTLYFIVLLADSHIRTQAVETAELLDVSF
ncbi:polysaccharide biosynthesis C-terminal domain-containing protein [Haloparvum alkalitolerans]|uniref:oligosaccharide flippase family protein n=1 Tax=Haloparvum alkalitolerans TaxID=1042953 RepID=UPI003CF2DEC9